MRTIIVSAANQGYSGLVEDLLSSIRRFSEMDAFDVGVLDLGLSEPSRSSMRSRGIVLVEPGWDIDLGSRMQSAPHLRAMTARPFLNRYFPDHDIIVWLDADIWIQDPEALSLYVQGAAEHGFAATPEIDRSYQTHHGPNAFTDFHDAVYRECFGPELGAKLRRFSLINSGAFAGKSSSPVWQHWAEIYERIANRTEVPHAEQAALNAAVWMEWETSGIALLPAVCNWICSLARPLWDQDRCLLVEPNLPHAPIGLVHMAGSTAPVTIKTLRGDEIHSSLRLSDIRHLCPAGRMPIRHFPPNLETPPGYPLSREGTLLGRE